MKVGWSEILIFNPGVSIFFPKNCLNEILVMGNLGFSLGKLSTRKKLNTQVSSNFRKIGKVKKFENEIFENFIFIILFPYKVSQ